MHTPLTPKNLAETRTTTNTRSLISALQRSGLVAIALVLSVMSALHKLQAVTVIIRIKSCTLSSKIQLNRAAP